MRPRAPRQPPPRASYAHRGLGWEAVVDAQHALYEGAGVASIVKNPAPMRPVGKAKNGVFPAVYVAEGPPDYAAMCRGACYLVDAKEHEGRWPLSKLPEHQARRFEKHVRQRGWAGVLLRTDAGIWLLPWERAPGKEGLREAWTRWREGEAARGEASLAPEDCDRIGVRLRSVDWLGTASVLFAEVPVGPPR
jgi:hypothetical protein